MKNSQLLLSVALGVAFWFAAALIVRFGGTAIFTENNSMLIVIYGVAFPVTGAFLFITKLFLNVSYNQLVRPIMVVTLTAALLDAVALSWFRALYSHSFEVALHGAALILWGVGLGLLAALWLEQRVTSPNRFDNY
ncbi:MAG: hypothetical protein EAZ91_10110 [Cytophagales bacterium]|nr:MAG: hypothetical protein EAZ91_10110 [Cytophagales bacterium]